MPEYTVVAATSVLVVVALELVALRTGLFRRPAYWLTLAIVWAFQIPVDGWLTKLSAPIVLYAPDQASGIRMPWDIPVEDFAFGFSLMTLTLLLWEHLARRERRPVDPDATRPGRDRASSRRQRPASPGRGPAPER
jgi:lycopene cyclase domain-containing protein